MEYDSTDEELKKFIINEQRRVLSLAYKGLFEGKDSEIVLDNLKAFCRYDTTSHVSGDPYSTAFLEGRREVFLHIKKYIEMSMGVD